MITEEMLMQAIGKLADNNVDSSYGYFIRVSEKTFLESFDAKMRLTLLDLNIRHIYVVPDFPDDTAFYLHPAR